MWRIIILLVAVLALAGCGANSPDQDGTDAVNLTELVRILPTQPGLDQTSSQIKSVDAPTLEGIFARREGVTGCDLPGLNWHGGVSSLLRGLVSLSTAGLTSSLSCRYEGGSTPFPVGQSGVNPLKTTSLSWHW